MRALALNATVDSPRCGKSLHTVRHRGTNRRSCGLVTVFLKTGGTGGKQFQARKTINIWTRRAIWSTLYI